MFSNINNLDLFIIFCYFVFIFILAYFAGKEVKSSDNTNLLFNQYLAGKKLGGFESLCSIIATEVSALTFLGIPAFAFSKDFSFIQVYFGAIFGRFVIAKYFLPRIFQNGLTIYESMGQNGETSHGRRSVALIYLINKILGVGVRLFTGSIMISEFFALSSFEAVSIIAIITFFYTMIGGLNAVVKTDVVQMFIFIIGGVVSHYYIPIVSNTSWTELMNFAYINGKTSFLNLSSPAGFITGVIGGFLFDMATHGVDQDYIQRLTGNKSLRSAQRTIFLSSFVSISVGTLFLGIGALLWAHYQKSPLPTSIEPDQLFAYFIATHFPVGIKGLIVAGVLAATMSTLDSTINAVSATLTNDIFQRKDLTKIKRSYIFDNCLITFLLILVAFAASKSSGLLELGLKIASWPGGAILGVFFITVLFPKYFKLPLSAPLVLGSLTLAVAFVWANTYLLNFSWHFNTYFGLFGALLFGKIWGQFTKNKN